MYSAEEFLKNRKIKLEKIDTSESEYDKIKEFDKAKSKVLKYAIYKKRTEQEIRQKFAKELEENMLNDIIDVLKENSYIDDYSYIERTINEFVRLKNLSIKEIRYKLLAKGIKSKLIDEYFYNCKEMLQEYEEKSAKDIVNKKSRSMDENSIKLYLMKKGYTEESIKVAFEED